MEGLTVKFIKNSNSKLYIQRIQQNKTLRCRYHGALNTCVSWWRLCSRRTGVMLLEVRREE